MQQVESYPRYKASHMKLITFTGTGILMVLSAFTIKKHHSGAVQPAALYDTKWYLTKVHSSSGSAAIPGKTAYIQFNRKKNSGGGHGSCNSFGSNTTIRNNEISFKNIFSTKMYCEGVQQTEDTFFKDLVEVNRYEIKDETLVLYHDTSELLEFSRE